MLWPFIFTVAHLAAAFVYLVGFAYASFLAVCCGSYLYRAAWAADMSILNEGFNLKLFLFAGALGLTLLSLKGVFYCWRMASGSTRAKPALPAAMTAAPHA